MEIQIYSKGYFLMQVLTSIEKAFYHEDTIDFIVDANGVVPSELPIHTTEVLPN